MSESSAATNAALPALPARSVLFLVTGSVNAALVPYWFHWLRQAYPDLTVHAVVTESAQRFVTVEALRRLVSGSVWTDSWDDPNLPTEAHVSLADIADCYAVFPATLDFTMRLAGGFGNTPALLALQMTTKPIVLAAAHPASNAVVEEMTTRLLKRENVAFSPTVPSYSVGKKKWEGETGFYLPGVLETLNKLLSSTT
ncbi:flavoprotein [Saccharomonospora sp.]|uniref:flavoprotein n=1 Tax=Saccharomonospora sp. TaxID=33913 RepID=UPI0026307EB0|nr:flavoprotein [Saccharomonospora sp.]